MAILIMTVTIIASALLCHYVAKQRGANPVFWGMMGLLFGPFAFPFVFMSKPTSKPKE